MTVISNDGRFEWDSGKNELNKKKHLLSFEEILEDFDDPAFLEIADTEHSVNEERFRGIGCIRGIVIITTCFMERGKRLRIINARKATSKEEKLYNEKYKEYYR